jgi:predicted AAA+ superfamily ATPase
MRKLSWAGSPLDQIPIWTSLYSELDERTLRGRRRPKPTYTKERFMLNAPIGKLFPRFAADRVTTALKDTPVVMVNGPRQCGKTTLVREFASRNRTYFTLDDDTVLESVRNDPSGFVRGLDMAIVDEVQRASELLRAIKKSVDRLKAKYCPAGSSKINSIAG